MKYLKLAFVLCALSKKASAGHFKVADMINLWAMNCLWIRSNESLNLTEEQNHYKILLWETTIDLLPWNVQVIMNL